MNGEVAMTWFDNFLIISAIFVLIALFELYRQRFGSKKIEKAEKRKKGAAFKT